MKVELNFIVAEQNGAKTYRSERPCPHHGLVDRYTANRGCVVCCRESSAKNYISKVGKVRKLTVKVHVDDIAIVEALATQMLEMRKWRPS